MGLIYADIELVSAGDVELARRGYIQKNEIKAEADDIRTVINGMAQSYEDPEQVVNWYYGDKDRLAEIEQMVLEDATVAWVLEKIKVTDEVVSFKEIMEPAA